MSASDALLARSRDLAGVVREFTVVIGGRGKGKEAVVVDVDDDESVDVSVVGVDISKGTQTPTLTQLIIPFLARSTKLASLTIVSHDDGYNWDEVLPRVVSRRLEELTLDVPSPIDPTVLTTFLSSQPRLVRLTLPNQFESIRPESETIQLSTKVPTTPSRPRFGGYYCIKGDNRAKRLRLSNPPPPRPVRGARIPPTRRSSSPSSLTVAYLPNLRTTFAPASFVLSLPSSCPLQSVSVSDKDLPKILRRRLFEKLGEHEGVSRLSVSLLPESNSNTSSAVLGVLHEITRNLRNLHVLEVKAIFKDAYFKVCFPVSSVNRGELEKLILLLE